MELLSRIAAYAGCRSLKQCIAAKSQTQNHGTTRAIKLDALMVVDVWLIRERESAGSLAEWESVGITNEKTSASVTHGGAKNPHGPHTFQRAISMVPRMRLRRHVLQTTRHTQSTKGCALLLRGRVANLARRSVVHKLHDDGPRGGYFVNNDMSPDTQILLIEGNLMSAFVISCECGMVSCGYGGDSRTASIGFYEKGWRDVEIRGIVCPSCFFKKTSNSNFKFSEEAENDKTRDVPAKTNPRTRGTSSRYLKPKKPRPKKPVAGAKGTPGTKTHARKGARKGRK